MKNFSEQNILMLAAEARESHKNIIVIPDREPDYAGIIGGITAVYDVWIDGDTLITRRYEAGLFSVRQLNLRPGLTLESALVILKNNKIKVEGERARARRADTALDDPENN